MQIQLKFSANTLQKSMLLIYHELVDRYEISISQIPFNLFTLTYIFPLYMSTVANLLEYIDISLVTCTFPL
jgi:hypothetical protein